MLGNLKLTNKLILLPVLENTFFHQRLALEVKNIYPFSLSHGALFEVGWCGEVQCNAV